MNQEGNRYAKRRCAQRQSAKPSAVHYLGYVEDDETPEMIMKKFQELEKIQQASSNQQQTQNQKQTQNQIQNLILNQENQSLKLDNQIIFSENNNQENTLEEYEFCENQQLQEQLELTEIQMEELFKNTSMFSVQSAIQNNQALAENVMDEFLIDENYNSIIYDKEIDDQEQKDEFSFSQENQFQQQLIQTQKKDQIQLNSNNNKFRNQNQVDLKSGPVMSCMMNGKRVIRNILENGQNQQQSNIQPRFIIAQIPENPCSFNNQEQNHIFKFEEIKSKLKNNIFLGILINQGWDKNRKCDLNQFTKINLFQFVPYGFMFIWLEKSQIQGVKKLMYQNGFQYVENLTWVILSEENSIAKLDGFFCRQSHKTLYIFRKFGKEIELRHQRSPDVVFDYMQYDKNGNWYTPAQVYDIIETLLPTASGEFMELWSLEGQSRPGWVHVQE